jgi:hypothetical protein
LPLVPAIGSLDVSSLDLTTLKAKALADTKAVRRKNGDSTIMVPWRSLSKRRTTLHAIFADAVEEGIVRSNPVAGVLRRRNVRERREQVGVTAKQFEALRLAAKGTPAKLYVA